MVNFSLLFSLPEHLRISIAICVASSNATNLGPLIASAKCGMELVFHPHVLQVASFDYLALLSPSVVVEGSKFCPFIIRCALARNPRACYLESLRLAAHEGSLEKSVHIIDN